jgi:hypothetical protein
LSFGGEDGDAPVYRYGKVLYFFQHVSESSNDTSSNEVSYTFAMCLWLIEEPNLAYMEPLNNGTWQLSTIHSALLENSVSFPFIVYTHLSLQPLILALTLLLATN